MAPSDYNEEKPSIWCRQSSGRSQTEEEAARDGTLSRRITRILMLCLLYIGFSAGLIAFNKHLMHKGRFPYAVPLALTQTAVCSALALTMFVGMPSLFPSLNDGLRQGTIDKQLFLKGVIPVALCLTMQLMLSNTALLHSSVAFLQMMKETNLVLVYIFSLIAMIEHFNWRSVCILVSVLIPAAFTIRGEIAFSIVGFAMQGTSQVFESAKIVLQAVMLSGAGKKLDSMTFVLLVMPFAFLFLSALLVIIGFLHPIRHFPIGLPEMSEVVFWFPALVGNACLAFGLNVVIAMLIKTSSPLAFIYAGIVKDAVIVFAGCGLFHDVITPIQIIGFSLQLIVILTWSLTKAFPEEFEKGIIQGIIAVFCGHEPELLPASDLLPKSQKEIKQYGAVEDNEGGNIQNSESLSNSNQNRHAMP